MPYIEEKDREELEPAIRAILAMLKSRKPRAVAGMLNYVISKIVWSMWTHDKCYDTGNTLIGALECAKTECTTQAGPVRRR